MSIPNLPTNFKDDILASSNTKRKYQQTFNSDGSVSLEDVTQYQQKGSDFGAQQVNQTNGAINNIYDERILTLEEAALVTEPGFFVDAQVIAELNSKLGENYIVEEGSNSNGKYRKWSNGTLEMWHSGNATCAIGTAAGSLYMSQEFTFTFPIASTTACFPVLSIIANGAIWGSASSSANSYRTSFKYRLMAATTWNLASFSYSYYARGTWK